MWQLMPGQTFRFRQYGEQFVLFNDLSGDTHLLGDSAMHVLGVLQQGPAAPAALTASLAQALACPHDDAFEDEAGAVLAQLAALSLIAPLP